MRFVLLAAGPGVDREGILHAVTEAYEDGPLSILRLDPAGSITKRAIVELDEKGNWTRDWTSAGPDRRSIVEPAGIAVDNAGYLYVTDWAVSRVVKYDPRKTP